MTQAQLKIGSRMPGQNDAAPTQQKAKVDEEKVLESLFEMLKNYRAKAHLGKYAEYREPAELEKLLRLDRDEGRADWDGILQWVALYLEHSVVTHHPRFLNRMWSGANLPSVIGEIVTAVSNTSAGTFESAPVSTLMEKYMIRQMLDLVGYPEGEGQMTTGSSNANLIAMMAARNIANHRIREKGLFAQQELFAFVSEDSHYSLDKAANLLGIGSAHLIRIPVDNHGQMDLHELEKRLQEVILAGGSPFFVCATAGTTVRGAYDPIEQLLELKRRFGFWLHVDGAWGGAAVFSDRLRAKYLKDVEMADSFTLDFHKMAGTSLICNILLFRNGDLLREAASVGDTSYIFGADNERGDYNLGSFSLQCGRRVDSLKWFLDWKYYGLQGFAERVESYHALCEYAEKKVTESAELEMVVERESFNICFRFAVFEGIPSNDFNRRLREELHLNGAGLVGSGDVGDDFCLRLLITNPKMDRREIDSFLKSVIDQGNLLLRKLWIN